MADKKALIVLIIDHDTHQSEHHENEQLTPDMLLEQGKFVNDDAAGIYGYEGWNIIHDASDGLMKQIAAESVPPKYD